MARISRPDPTGAAWRKSSYSNQAGGDCAEAADGFQGAVVPVRDSKAPHGPTLCFDATAWTASIGELKTAPGDR
ncbi:DUF397 domain-containing protein [Streptomyces iakyrus]